MNQYITLASDSVIWENIGGQVLAANLNTGVYCNLEGGVACVIWHLLMSGLKISELEEAMRAHYENLPPTFDLDYQVLIEKLIKADIWTFSCQPLDLDKPISRIIREYHEKTEYKKPRILIYDDINTLLQIDPIDDEIGELLHADSKTE